MRHVVLSAVLVSVAALAGPAVAAGDEDETPTMEDLELLERRLEMEARESELAHEAEMRELETEERRIELERMRHGGAWRQRRDGGGVVLLLILVANILLTVWVCKDMREQEIGRALWVPIVLLTGVFGAILYAIVRSADVRPRRTRSR